MPGRRLPTAATQYRRQGCLKHDEIHRQQAPFDAAQGSRTRALRRGAGSRHSGSAEAGVQCFDPYDGREMPSSGSYTATAKRRVDGGGDLYASDRSGRRGRTPGRSDRAVEGDTRHDHSNSEGSRSSRIPRSFVRLTQMRSRSEEKCLPAGPSRTRSGDTVTLAVEGILTSPNTSSCSWTMGGLRCAPGRSLRSPAAVYLPLRQAPTRRGAMPLHDLKHGPDAAQSATHFAHMGRVVAETGP